MEERLEIVAKSRPLDHPGEGYFVISPGQTILKKFEDMCFSGDLVPRLVRLKLKEALKKALESERYFEGELIFVPEIIIIYIYLYMVVEIKVIIITQQK